MSDKTGAAIILGNKNLKITKARKLVLEILKGSLPKTASEIFSLTKDNNGELSLSTVYRTCETLSQKGILIKSNLIDDGIARYEYLETEHIHHAICLECKRIFSIEDCPFGQFDKLMQSKYDFDVKSHRIEIYGYCHDCKQKMDDK